MNVNTKITEEDIFKYVFYLESLDAEKKSFINDNYSKYVQEIEFCREMKSEEEIELPQIIIDKLLSRICENSKIITLYPQIEKKNEQKMFLAAASNTEEYQISSLTLIDKNSDYLIKILNYNQHSEIFVFSNDFSPINKFNLTILPQSLKLSNEDSAKLITTEKLANIEKIELHYKV